MSILHTLAQTADLSLCLARGLACEAVDVAIDRGLALLADHRPWRVVARPDYIMRYYLGGRMGHAFPEGTPATLGGLGGTAYLHRIGSPDAGRAHHSHPWEWAISVVLAGGYTEEVFGADGSVTTRRRAPGSVAVINAGSFHRIAELHAPRVWTLFITGPRTPDRAWYFRRLDGSIVHESDYHANLEQERKFEEQWAADVAAERVGGIRGVVRCCTVDGAVIALVDDDYTDGSMATVCAPLGVDWTPYSSERQYEARRAARRYRWAPGVEPEQKSGTVALDDEQMERAGAIMRAVYKNPPLLPGREAERETERAAKDRASAPTVVETGPGGWWGDAFTMGPGVRVFADREDLVEAYGKTSFPVRVHDGEVAPVFAYGRTTDEQMDARRRGQLKAAGMDDAAADAQMESEANIRRLLADGAGAEPVPPVGYTFETLSPAPAIVIRHGGSYVGSLLTNGTAVAHGAQVKPAELARHADAWAHARTLRTAAPKPKTYHAVGGKACSPPFVAFGFGFNASDDDAVGAYQKLRKTVADEGGVFCGGVTVVDAMGLTVRPGLPPDANHPHDPACWDIALVTRGVS